jgi:hypothetical protein
MEIQPVQLLLRCYGRKTANGWYAHCIDLNLDAEAGTFSEVKRSLEDAIVGYLETALDTDDPSSLEGLLSRPSPLRHRLAYFAMKYSVAFKKVLSNSWEVFKEPIPIKLHTRCA